jgi:hypothetical protein
LLTQVKWSRAARTDKGVHALGNLVALKVLLRKQGGEGVETGDKGKGAAENAPTSHDKETVAQLVKDVNSFLPPGQSRCRHRFPTVKEGSGDRWQGICGVGASLRTRVRSGERRDGGRGVSAVRVCVHCRASRLCVSICECPTTFLRPRVHLCARACMGLRGLCPHACTSSVRKHLAHCPHTCPPALTQTHQRVMRGLVLAQAAKTSGRSTRASVMTRGLTDQGSG